jgi:hypothetical protein
MTIESMIFVDGEFTVPLYDEFMKREMPEWGPPTRKPTT